jgi:hypothetical protein
MTKTKKMIRVYNYYIRTDAERESAHDRIEFRLWKATADIPLSLRISVLHPHRRDNVRYMLSIDNYATERRFSPSSYQFHFDTHGPCPLSSDVRAFFEAILESRDIGKVLIMSDALRDMGYWNAAAIVQAWCELALTTFEAIRTKDHKMNLYIHAPE